MEVVIPLTEHRECDHHELDAVECLFIQHLSQRLDGRGTHRIRDANAAAAEHTQPNATLASHLHTETVLRSQPQACHAFQC